MDLYERGKKAKGCDLFISLHSNAIGYGTVTPAQEKVNRVCVYHSFDNKNNSSVLGTALAGTVANVMGISENRLCTRVGITGKNEYYSVLRGARNIGCPLYYIIEHSFHTNTKSANWLLEDENLRKLARAEAICIHSYFYQIKKGDVNKDGQVDSFDYLMVKSAVLGNLKLTEEQKEIADMNNDKQVDAFDYMILKSEVLGNGKK